MLYGCSSKPPTPDSYDASEVGKVSQVVSGVVISQQLVNITQKATQDTSNSMFSSFGSQPPQPALDYNGSDKGIEYIIKLNTGNVISIVQAQDLKLKVNQRVLVIYGPTTRVVADEANN